MRLLSLERIFLSGHLLRKFCSWPDPHKRQWAKGYRAATMELGGGGRRGGRGPGVVEVPFTFMHSPKPKSHLLYQVVKSFPLGLEHLQSIKKVEDDLVQLLTYFSWSCILCWSHLK